MQPLRSTFGIVVASLALAALGAQPAPDFRREIQPLLVDRCYECHGPDAAKRKAELRLDQRAAAVADRDGRGPAVVPGDAARSLLIERVTHADPDERMPPATEGPPLTGPQIAMLRRWIEQGADWPEHWAFVPPVRPEPPPDDSEWSRNEIDRFVLAAMQARGLHPNPRADPATLCRRVHLALTGLPPSLAELDAFLGDDDPEAYENLVRRLLKSPRYGEHQARFWLDLARYADTNGYEKDRPRSMHAWRDRLIEALNENQGFDLFTIEQLAGDLVAKDVFDKGSIASGFHRNSMLNDEDAVDPEEFRIAAVKDRLHTTATVWLGLTLECAQCHDHKFDPFSQREYYRLFAFFDQTEDDGVGFGPTEEVPTPAQAAEIAALAGQLERLRARIAASNPALAPGRDSWIASVAGRLAEHAANPIDAASWSHAGSWPAGTIDRALATAFPPEAKGADVAWTPRPEWRDGERRELPGRDCAHYLRRTLTVERARDATIDLRCGDGVVVWVGGREVLRQRGARASGEPELGRFEVTIPLAAGANEILLKLVQGRAPGGFRFAIRAGKEPDEVLAAAATPRAQRTPGQEQALDREYRELAPELAELRAERRRLEGVRARLPVATTLVMRERATRRPTHVLERGAFDRKGVQVEPGFPEALHAWRGRRPAATRADLAAWLVDTRNPLAGRVLANRIWAHHFGRGIVATLDDFGVRGALPTHPELLDWLATTFRLDQKRLHERIVLSATFRQASDVTAEQRAKDPDNLWLARFPRTRLTFEEVRDVALTAAGILDDRIGGPSVMPPQPPGVWEQSFGIHDLPDRWVEATGRDRWRRGIYVYQRRTAPYPTYVLFDGAERNVCKVQRSQTITPLQALATMNDPVFVEAAAHLANAVRDRDELRGLRALLRRCVARAPDAKELETLRELLATARARFAKEPDAARALLAQAHLTDDAADAGNVAELAAWTVVANAVLNLDETLTNH